MLFKDSTREQIDAIVAVEKRADRCLEKFGLASLRGDQAVWTVLSEIAVQIERTHDCHGPDSSEFSAALINLARYGPAIVRELWTGMPQQTEPSSVRTWSLALSTLAGNDIRLMNQYDALQSNYPMWYQNRTDAELLADGTVRFTASRGARDRQVSAYQKGLRPSVEPHRSLPKRRMEPTESMLKQYRRLLDEASLTGQFSFTYEHPYRLARRTLARYEEMLSQVARRSSELSLGEYTLGHFEAFYAAILSICAIHEYMCFCWMKRGHPYPVGSAVLVKTRAKWIELLSGLCQLNEAIVEQMLSDFTFQPNRLADLHVYPFVPLDQSASVLALVPQIALNANHEENILRICSYLRQKSYSLLSDDKEAVMIEDASEKLSGFNVSHGLALPDGSTEIDLIVEDLSSSTILIAELKWYRGPNGYRERLRADEQLNDGVNRQLSTVKRFCGEHSSFLRQRGKVSRDLSEYRHVYYLLLARDHWAWLELDGIPVVADFDQFLNAVGRHETLRDALTDLLAFEWLPVEDRDFHVTYDTAIVEAVTVQSEVFYGGPPKNEMVRL